MLTLFKWISVAVAVLSALLAGVAFIGANQAYDLAARYMAEATYQAECQNGGDASSGCAGLARDRMTSWPNDVPLTDQSLLLTQATTVHSTGSAVLSISGLLLTVTGLMFTVATMLGGRQEGRRARRGP